MLTDLDSPRSRTAGAGFVAMTWNTPSGRLLTSVAWVLVAGCVVLVRPAVAARFHVSIDGTRTSGPSAPAVWDLDNCYASLAAAFAEATTADTVLVDNQIHALDTGLFLPALLGNRDLSASPSATEILVGTGGAFQAGAGQAAVELRGLTIAGTPEERSSAAVVIADTSGDLAVVTMRGCRFHDLHGGSQPAGGGGAVCAVSPGHGASLEFADCTFDSNSTRGTGGAVWIGADYDVLLDHCTFSGNAAVAGGLGGGLAVMASSSPSRLTAEDCIFDGNASGGPGGALNIDGATLVMRRCQVFGSRSAFEPGAFWKEGAGLRVTRSGGHTDPVTVLLEDCEFRDNQGNPSDNNGAGDGGGAILVKGGDLTRMVGSRSTAACSSDNTNAQGAGIYIGRFCEGTVSHCRFLDNIAWYQGGGAFKGGELPECEGELATFAYCEFRGNRAGFRPDGTETGEYSRGGGVMVRAQPARGLVNCTFVDNRVNSFAYRIGDGFRPRPRGRRVAAREPVHAGELRLLGQRRRRPGPLRGQRRHGAGLARGRGRRSRWSVPGVVPTATVALAQLPVRLGRSICIRRRLAPDRRRHRGGLRHGPGGPVGALGRGLRHRLLRIPRLVGRRTTGCRRRRRD